MLKPFTLVNSELPTVNYSMVGFKKAINVKFTSENYCYIVSL